MNKLWLAVMVVLMAVGCGERGEPDPIIPRGIIIKDATSTLYGVAVAKEMRGHNETYFKRQLEENKVVPTERYKIFLGAWRMAMDNMELGAASYLVHNWAKDEVGLNQAPMVRETFDLAHAESAIGIMGALVHDDKLGDMLSIEQKKSYADLRCAELVEYGDEEKNDQKREQLTNEFFNLLKDYGSCTDQARTMAIRSAKDSLRYGHADWACNILADNVSADKEAVKAVLTDLNIPPTLVKQFTDCVETKAAPRTETNGLSSDYLANRTEAEEARDCAILYNTAGTHEEIFMRSGKRQHAEIAVDIYKFMLTECPNYIHNPEAKLAAEELEAKLY